MADTKEEKKVGRPTKYKKEYNTDVIRLSRAGNTREQMAKFFGVSRATIFNWQNSEPEFLDSIRKGEAESNCDVAAALYMRAIGSTYFEKKVVEKANSNKETTIIEKWLPPDVAAAYIWLKNKMPDQWKDNRETVNTNGLTEEAAKNLLGHIKSIGNHSEFKKDQQDKKNDINKVKDTNE